METIIGYGHRCIVLLHTYTRIGDFWGAAFDVVFGSFGVMFWIWVSDKILELSKKYQTFL